MKEPPMPCHVPPVMSLAFLGDGVYSLLVRDALVRDGKTGQGALHEAALAYVTCEAQQAAYRRLCPHLTEYEADLCRRAYNSTHLRKPKHAKGDAYRCATALEALFGYLQWAGEPERIAALFAVCREGEHETPAHDTAAGTSEKTSDERRGGAPAHDIAAKTDAADRKE